MNYTTQFQTLSCEDATKVICDKLSSLAIDVTNESLIDYVKSKFKRTPDVATTRAQRMYSDALAFAKMKNAREEEKKNLGASKTTTV